MIRWSIFDNKERFKSALIETHELSRKGMNSNEIVQTLSSTYQESDIKKLLQWMQDSSKMNEYTKYKMILKVSLWVLLIYKTFFLFAFPKTMHMGVTWEIVLMILIPILNIFGLVLAYRVIPSSYVTIFILYSCGISGFVDNVSSLFSFETGILVWILTFIYTLAYLIGGYVSFRLFRSLPEGLIRTNKIIEQIKHNSTAVA